MGLIDQAQERNNVFQSNTPTATVKDNPKIMQASLLLSIANKVLDMNLLPTKAKKRCANNRTRLSDANWRLESLLGIIDEDNMVTMIGRCLEGQEKTILHSQPNGTWKVVDYEADIRRDPKGEERLFLAVKWVDIDNKAELQYQNGAPSVNVNITSPELPKELLAALSKKGGNDNELKGLLKDLIGAMAKQNQSTVNPDPIPPAFNDHIPE